VLKSESLLKDAEKKAIDAKKKFNEAPKVYTEDGVMANIRPYMGVNEFLEGLTNSNDKLFFPEFIEHNYWFRRFLAWGEGDYTDDELELFGFNKNNAPKLDVHPDLKNFNPDDYKTEKAIKEAFEKVTT
jgi:hypothetical protein